MRWTRGGRSSNVEDRRAEGGGGFRGGGLKIGLGGLVLLGVLSLATGKNFFALLQPGDGGLGAPGEQSAPDPARDAQEQPLVDFVHFVLDDVQGTWQRVRHGEYQDAKLVLFRDAIGSACGFAESATGPFYCPGDQKIYVDLGFYDDLKRRFGAPGDFAQAYVIAHEIGHHVQNLSGIERQVREQQRARPDQQNALSVLMELQADCLAGVWAHDTEQRQILEQGDVEEGLNAAAAIGDDRLQKQGRGRVNPESFTHGSSAQRVSWFKRGLESGDPNACDTFAAGRP